MAEENLGTAAIYLTVDTTKMDAGVKKAQLQLAGMGKEAQAQYEAMSAGQRKLAAGYVKQIEMLGKTRAEQIAYNAQLKLGGALGNDIARQALANAQATAAANSLATDAAQAAAAAQAEMAAAEDARFKKIAADAMAEVEARQAITAATMDQARANAALAEAQGAGTAGNAAAAIGTLEASTVKQQIVDYAALDAIMGKKVATTEEVAAAEAALDRLQAAGMLSNEELAASFAALDVVTAAETKALQANSAAQLENAAATGVNSKVQYEIGVLLGETASGNTSRIKRSIPALLNAMRLTSSSAGVSFLGSAAALGVLAAATFKGEQEFSNFNKTLIATGNYSGLTYTKYRALAESLSGSDTSIGKAKDVLNALAETGKFTGDQLGIAAQAALNMAQLTGDSVNQAVASIAKLRDDPVKAIEALDEQYHFLSTATLQRIQQLQDRGDKEAAANLAEQAYADALGTRAAQMEKSLGTLQRVWESLGKSASFAWDQMQGLGRPTTKLDDLGAQYDKLLKLRMSVSDRLAGKGTLMDFFNSPDAIGGKSTAGMSLQQQLAAIDAMLAKIRGDTKPLQDAANAAAQSKADTAALQQAGNEGVATLAKLGINLDGIKNKQDKVREAATALFNIYRAGGQLPKGVSFGGPIADVPVGAGWDAIKAQLLKGDPSVMAAQRAAKQAAEAQASFHQFAQGQVTGGLVEQGDAALTKYVQDIAKLIDQFDKAKAKGANLGAITSDYWKAAAGDADKYQEAVRKANAEDAATIATYKTALDKQTEALQQSLALQVASVGMGQKEYERYQQLTKVAGDYADQIARLHAEQTRNQATMGADRAEAIFNQEAAAAKAAAAIQTKAYTDAFAQIDAKQGDWKNGAIKAMDDFQDKAKNVAGATYDFFNNMFSGLADSIASFVVTGKGNFKDLLDSLLEDAVRTEAQLGESKLFSMIENYFGVGGGFNEGSAATAATSIISALGYAKGGVFGPNGAITAFANGGVVNDPTYFRYGGGIGVMAENRPESIMPLTRMPDGELGVRMKNPTTAKQQTIYNNSSTYISVQPTTTRRTANQIAEANARKQRIAVARG